MSTSRFFDHSSDEYSDDEFYSFDESDDECAPKPNYHRIIFTSDELTAQSKHLIIRSNTGKVDYSQTAISLLREKTNQIENGSYLLRESTQLKGMITITIDQPKESGPSDITIQLINDAERFYRWVEVDRYSPEAIEAAAARFANKSARPFTAHDCDNKAAMTTLDHFLLNRQLYSIYRLNPLINPVKLDNRDLPHVKRTYI